MPAGPPPAMTQVVEICRMTLPARDLAPRFFSGQAATYQQARAHLYCWCNHFEKEVIQCLIVISCRVPRPGFSLPERSAGNATLQATTMRKAVPCPGRGLSFLEKRDLGNGPGGACWWPRSESNGHVPFGTTDFKSGASI